MKSKHATITVTTAWTELEETFDVLSWGVKASAAINVQEFGITGWSASIPVAANTPYYQATSVQKIRVAAQSGSASVSYSLLGFIAYRLEGQNPEDVYLYLNGSNANQNIDIGSFDFTTTGTINAGDGNITTLNSTTVNADVVNAGDVQAGTATIGDGTNETEFLADGTLQMKGTAHIPYGSMYLNDGTIAVSIAANHTYYDVGATLLDGGSNGFTFQNGNELKCLSAGKYMVNWSLSLVSNVSDTTIEGLVKINTTGQENTANATRAKEDGVVYSVGGAGVITLAVNDVVKLAVERENGAGGSTITVNHATLTLLKVGG